MIQPSYRDELLREIAGLDADRQRLVLEYTRKLSAGEPALRKEAIARLAGSVLEPDATLMREAIERDCERVDGDAW